MKNLTAHLDGKGERIPGTTFVNGKNLVWTCVGFQILDPEPSNRGRRRCIPMTFERKGGDYALIIKIHSNGDFFGRWLISRFGDGDEPKELLFSRGGSRHLLKKEVNHLLRSGLLTDAEWNIAVKAQGEEVLTA